MKKELSYFSIEGAFGGNQDWFTNVVMHFGGCAAATACDSSIYLAREKGLTRLYPFDRNALNKKDYIAFSQKMKPFLRPRVHGVCRLWMYTEGFGNYLKEVYQEEKIPLKMEEFSGDHTWQEAAEFIREKIDRGFPIPCLLLEHQNRKKFEDFIWHWFLLAGYESREEDGQFLVQTATYGEALWFSLEEMWNTGFEEKGGLIGYEIPPQGLRMAVDSV